MRLNMENETMLINLESDELQNNFSSRIEIVKVEDFLYPAILKRTKLSQWVIVFLFWLPIIIGTYFRFIIYEYMFRQYKSKELTEVNKLMLVVRLTNHLFIVCIPFATTLMVINGESLDQFTVGQWYCILQMVYIRYAYYYSFIGSLGISIYRILLIKHNYFLKNIIGKKVMANLILYGGVLLAIFFTLVQRSHDYNKLFDDTCMFVAKLDIMHILDNYEQSRGDLSIMEYYTNVVYGNGLVGALMTISEITIYIIFFHHMYKNNNSDGLRRLLEPKVINARNRKNVITFFSQFCSFVLEFIGLLLLVASYTVGNRKNKLPLVAIAFQVISFAMMSAVEVFTSDVLRKNMFKINLYDVIFGLR